MLASLRKKNALLGLEALRSKPRIDFASMHGGAAAHTMRTRTPQSLSPTRSRALAPLSACVSSAALAAENARLRAELDDARRSSHVADGSRTSHVFELGARAAGGCCGWFAADAGRGAERRAQQAEIRAVMAEEQLGQLNAYMARATNTYQTEIVRLRKQLARLDKAAAHAPLPSIKL